MRKVPATPVRMPDRAALRIEVLGGTWEELPIARPLPSDLAGRGQAVALITPALT